MPTSSTISSQALPSTSFNTLQVQCIPAFDDNYFWLIHNGRDAAVVDPGASAPIVAALEAQQLSLCAILITHHHADHCGGVSELLQQQSGPIPVYGPRQEAIKGINHALAEGESIHITALGLDLAIFDLPGHTLGHIAYYAAKEAWLFCGDTLFAGGCGRLFEGSPGQMLASLNKLSALPDSTLVYCAHEYTLANLKFAQEVDANNPDLIERIRQEQAKRTQGIPTVPSHIGLEKATNPFLRCGQEAIISRLTETGRLPDGKNPVQIFAALREWKNNYR